MELINISKDVIMAIVGYDVTGGTKIPAWKAIKPGKTIEVSEDTVVRNLKAGLVKVETGDDSKKDDSKDTPKDKPKDKSGDDSKKDDSKALNKPTPKKNH